MDVRTYWLSFRLKQNKSYDERLEELGEAVERVCQAGHWWADTTSFYLFSSGLAVDTIAMHVASAIDSKVDIVVIGSTDKKVGRVIGTYTDDTIFALAPFMKKH